MQKQNADSELRFSKNIDLGRTVILGTKFLKKQGTKISSDDCWQKRRETHAALDSLLQGLSITTAASWARGSSQPPVTLSFSYCLVAKATMPIDKGHTNSNIGTNIRKKQADTIQSEYPTLQIFQVNSRNELEFSWDSMQIP